MLKKHKELQDLQWIKAFVIFKYEGLRCEKKTLAYTNFYFVLTCEFSKYINACIYIHKNKHTLTHDMHTILDPGEHKSGFLQNKSSPLPSNQSYFYVKLQ